MRPDQWQSFLETAAKGQYNQPVSSAPAWLQAAELNKLPEKISSVDSHYFQYVHQHFQRSEKIFDEAANAGIKNFETYAKETCKGIKRIKNRAEEAIGLLQESKPLLIEQMKQFPTLFEHFKTFLPAGALWIPLTPFTNPVGQYLADRSIGRYSQAIGKFLNSLRYKFLSSGYLENGEVGNLIVTTVNASTNPSFTLATTSLDLARRMVGYINRQNSNGNFLSVAFLGFKGAIESATPLLNLLQEIRADEHSLVSVCLRNAFIQFDHASPRDRQPPQYRIYFPYLLETKNKLVEETLAEVSDVARSGGVLMHYKFTEDLILRDIDALPRLSEAVRLKNILQEHNKPGTVLLGSEGIRARLQVTKEEVDSLPEKFEAMERELRASVGWLYRTEPDEEWLIYRKPIARKPQRKFLF